MGAEPRLADAPSQTQDPPQRAARKPAAAMPSVVLPPVDVRRKKPPQLSFLLRMETLRRASRVVSLLALDFAALWASIFTALMVKAVLRDGEWAWHASSVEAGETVAFAYLVMVLLFARGDLYAERAQRPGLPRIVTSLFQVMLVALVFAVVNGEQYSSYYIFYGTLVFAILFVGGARNLYERATGVLLRAAGYRRRAVLVGSGKHIEDVAHALTDEVHTPVEMVGFISLTPRPDNGLRSLGRIDDLPDVLDAHRVQEVIIADPDFPEERAVELVDQCHRRGVTVRIAPSTMEILVHRAEFVPGASVPLFELRPPVFDGVDYVVKRTFDFCISALLILLSSARCCWPARPPSASPRAARSSTARSARASAASRSPASSSAPCARTPTSCRPSWRPPTRPPGRCSRSARTRAPRASARCCDATRSTSCRSCSTCSRARCRSSGRARCPSATSTSSRSGTRSATSCCRA